MGRISINQSILGLAGEICKFWIFFIDVTQYNGSRISQKMVLVLFANGGQQCQCKLIYWWVAATLELINSTLNKAKSLKSTSKALTPTIYLPVRQSHPPTRIPFPGLSPNATITQITCRASSRNYPKNDSTSLRANPWSSTSPTEVTLKLRRS